MTTIVTREVGVSAKGSPLTNTEIDNNFINLNNGKQEVLGFTPLDAALVGAANGVAPLGADNKVAAVYLPSYVDDVLEYAALASFPATGETGKIYIALDSNTQYRWSGSVYVALTSSPGSTDAVAEGSVNLYFTTARVLATLLSGLSLAVGSAVVSTDSLLVAIGKLQKQISDIIASKDASGGIVGMTLFKINFKNAANSVTSYFTNSNTVSRTYTFQNRDGTIADNTDLATKANLAAPSLTGAATIDTFLLGYRGLPQNRQSAAYTFVATDSGKIVIHPSADTTARVWSIPASGFTVDNSVLIVRNQNSAGAITVNIAGGVIRRVGTNITGSVRIAAGGLATFVYEEAGTNEWSVSGIGLT